MPMSRKVLTIHSKKKNNSKNQQLPLKNCPLGLLNALSLTLRQSHRTVIFWFSETMKMCTTAYGCRQYPVLTAVRIIFPQARLAILADKFDLQLNVLDKVDVVRQVSCCTHHVLCPHLSRGCLHFQNIGQPLYVRLHQKCLCPGVRGCCTYTRSLTTNNFFFAIFRNTLSTSKRNAVNVSRDWEHACYLTMPVASSVPRSSFVDVLIHTYDDNYSSWKWPVDGRKASVR